MKSNVDCVFLPSHSTCKVHSFIISFILLQMHIVLLFLWRSRIRLRRKNLQCIIRDRKPLKHWARLKFDVNLKSNDKINNFLESFNNGINKLRKKPMLIALEEIRKLVGARFDKNVSEYNMLGWESYTICWQKANVNGGRSWIVQVLYMLWYC